MGGLQRAPASIWVTEGKSWVCSLALTLDNSAPGLLSPLPIYKSDRLRALRAPGSYGKLCLQQGCGSQPQSYTISPSTSG